MTINGTQLLLLFMAIGTGVMAGVYLAFSAFIMQSLARIAPAGAIAAMQSINTVILRSLFMPLFFGTSLGALILFAMGIVTMNAANSIWYLVAGATYFLGMFVCTACFNVPLNRSLARLDPHNPRAQGQWHHFLKVWTRWNHARTIASLLTCVSCIWLLLG